MQKKQKVIVIVGPTSSGKSALAVQIARKFNGEVVSADSRQVYKGLNIGTGKITRREMKGIRHYLLDEVSPHRIFAAHDFIERGRKAIDDIASRGKLPVIAGGAGFYIDALLGRVALPDVPANASLRAKFEKKTAAQLFAELQRKDPRRARSIDPHNKRRLIRALEIIVDLGRTPHIDIVSRYDELWIGLKLRHDDLAKKIHIRLLGRMRGGMIAEAKRLHTQGLSYKRMEQLGLEYRALAEYLRGKVSRRDMIERLTCDIRHYAKRQLTYWRRNERIQWFNPNDRKKIVVQTQKFIGGR